MSFQSDFTPYAQRAALGTGLGFGLFLAQWAVETAYGTAFAGAHNLGNITRGGASQGFVDYGSYDEFVNAEVLLLHDASYAGILASAGTTLGEQCRALGASPWDAGHYDDGGGPGSSLIATLSAFGMNSTEAGVAMDQATFNALVAASPLANLAGGIVSTYNAVLASQKAILTAISAIPAASGGLSGAQAVELQEAHDAAQKALADLQNIFKQT